MILQIGADCRFVDDHIDTVLLKVLTGADARQHHDLRRIECARREHHCATGTDGALLVADRIGHAGNPAILDLEALDANPDPDIEIFAAPLGLHIGARGRPAFALFLRHLI